MVTAIASNRKKPACKSPSVLTLDSTTAFPGLQMLLSHFHSGMLRALINMLSAFSILRSTFQIPVKQKLFDILEEKEGLKKMTPLISQVKASLRKGTEPLAKLR